jgi:hypothetical protein
MRAVAHRLADLTCGEVPRPRAARCGHLDFPAAGFLLSDIPFPTPSIRDRPSPISSHRPDRECLPRPNSKLPPILHSAECSARPAALPANPSPDQSIRIEPSVCFDALVPAEYS